jgi:glycosyltransferase involved in cell wall biosynthesis
VVFVDHSTEAGGAEYALVRLLATSQSWEPTVVVPNSHAHTPGVFADLRAGVRVVQSGPPQEARIKAGNSPLASAALAWRILRSAAALCLSSAVRKADVVIANTTRSSVYATIAATVLRKPTVVHIRDLIEPEAVGAVATKLMRQLVLPRASAVIANSSASLALVKPFLKRGAVATVIPSPSGLQLEPAGEVARSVARVGMVARLDPWKGQELLIRAFARAFPEGDATLVLYGGPAFGHDVFAVELRELADSLGLADRVEFAGHVSDVRAAIKSLDVCVQYSIRPEPLGQNVLQYLAAGKPTLVAAEGGPVEWIVDGVNGILVPPRDASSLAEALQKVAEPAVRQHLAEKAIETPGLLTDEQVGAKVAAVVEQVAIP